MARNQDTSRQEQAERKRRLARELDIAEEGDIEGLLTEEEWFASHNARDMIRHLGGRLSDRKSRLLSCAIARLVWDVLLDERSRNAVEVAERSADGNTSVYELELAEKQANEVATRDHERQLPQHQHFRAIAAKMCAITKPNAAGVCHFVVGFSQGGENLLTRTANLVRDIAGNPFRPVIFSPAWRTSDAVALARTMYEAREFSAMPILADALQDAGCDSDDILNHCRDTAQVHVRGCWVIDLVLGKQ